MIPEEPKSNIPSILALVVSCLLHLFLLIYSPKLWDAFMHKNIPEPKPFTLTIEPLPSPQKPTFAEANVNAPTVEDNPNAPFFSDRSTLAAQPNPTPTDNPLPSIDGNLEDSLRIVQGNPQTPSFLPPEPQSPPQPSTTQPHTPQKAQSTPIALDLGTHSTLSKDTPAQKTSTPKPRPRPQLDRSTIGPLAKNSQGTSKLGVLSINAQFSEFGDYLARMFEGINYQWQLLVRNYKYSSSDFRSYVVVKFSIFPSGDIQNVEIAYSNTSDLAAMLAKDSILSLAPYSPWTQEMLLTLGDSQTITIGFYY